MPLRPHCPWAKQKDQAAPPSQTPRRAWGERRTFSWHLAGLSSLLLCSLPQGFSYSRILGPSSLGKGPRGLKKGERQVDGAESSCPSEQRHASLQCLPPDSGGSITPLPHPGTLCPLCDAPQLICLHLPLCEHQQLLFYPQPLLPPWQK